MLTKRETEVLEYIITMDNLKNRMPTKTELYPNQIEFSVVRD